MNQKERNLYYRYSDYLKHKYGEKVYKLPVNLPITCPNRDGTIGHDGCYFCSAKGTGFESLDDQMSVKDQLTKNMSYIGTKYKANKFIAYFQNYTNTYMPIEEFTRYMNDACIDHIVDIDISTRPDCISRPYLDILQTIRHKNNIDITMELGLQTTNNATLKFINRGHTVEDYINAVKLIKKYNFNICTHFILNLPGDTRDDTINNAKLINELGVEQVKLHALYIAKGTKFASMYNQKALDICSKEEYIDRVITFLEYLNPNVVIQRIIGRAPKEETIFCNWDTSWWKIKDELEHKMISLNTYQGIKFKVGN